MTYAIFYLITNVLLLVAELTGQKMVSNGVDSQTNILIAVGIVSICWRLDKLIDKTKQPCGK